MRSLQAISLEHLPAGQPQQLPLPQGSELVAAYGGPQGGMLTYLSDSGASYAGLGPTVLVVGEYSTLPDLHLRWLGLFFRPGYPNAWHVFEVLP